MRRDPNASARMAARPSHRPFVTLVVAVCLIAGVLVVVVPPASATPRWSVVPSPRPPGYGSVGLDGVSCPSTTNCYAVGAESPPNGVTAAPGFIEHWNGRSWSILSSPNPTGAASIFLSGVSCRSTTSCFAVGELQNQFSKTLVERLSGNRWSIMPSPNPTGSANSSLSGVSCRSASCFAVGSTHVSHWMTLVEHWAGNHWSIVTSPNPTGFQSANLGGVSCPSTTSCFAVGLAQFRSGSATLMEHWNGQRWSIMPSPTLTGASMRTVSCSTAATCMAVGSYSVSGIDQSLVEDWNGHTWSVTPSPNPIGSIGTVLNGVSCPTSTHCFAVGNSSYAVSRGPFRVGAAQKTLVEQWNGHTWSIVRSRNPSPGGFKETVLNGVSCHRNASCFAVGDFGGPPNQIFGSATTNLIERDR